MTSKHEKIITPPDTSGRPRVSEALLKELEASKSGSSGNAQQPAGKPGPEPQTPPPQPVEPKPTPTPAPIPQSPPSSPPKAAAEPKQPAEKPQAVSRPEPQPAVQAYRDLPFMKVFLLSFFLGIFGADRYYLGYNKLAIAKLLTLGGFLVWAYVDTVLILMGVVQGAGGVEINGRKEHFTTAAAILGVVTLLGFILAAAILPMYLF